MTTALHTCVPEHFHLDTDGQLKLYFSEALDTLDQREMQCFAMNYVNSEGQDGPEVNLDIVLDLPKMFLSTVVGTYCEPLPNGTFLTEVSQRGAFEKLKKDLLESIAILDKIVYEGEV